METAPKKSRAIEEKKLIIINADKKGNFGILHEFQFHFLRTKQTMELIPIPFRANQTAYGIGFLFLTNSFSNSNSFSISNILRTKQPLRDIRGFQQSFTPERVILTLSETTFLSSSLSHIKEDWRILDFLSHHPESLNTLTYLLDDVGIPADYRQMEGSCVSALTLVNKQGKMHYVKFKWSPTCGVKCLTDDEAVKIGGANHSHATQDLYYSIEAGNFPEWKLFLQAIDPDEEDGLDHVPLDNTMVWPEDKVPLQPVGRMVLNKNIDNFFAENEQLAFNPGVVVPGIYYSDDKMLQGRIFAYSDAQRHRLGANYLQLPVNAPRPNALIVDYFPSRYDRVQHAPQYPTNQTRVTGTRERTVIPKFDDFKQPGERYRSWDPERQERFIYRMVIMLSDPRVTHEPRDIWISYWTQADRSLGQKIAARLKVRPNF
ncbi:hypothetical protein LXL04_012010 [Taraxacum kok-saghyz]